MLPNASLFSHLKEAYKYAKEYFLNSEQRYKASFMLVLAVICVVGLVLATAGFSWWWVMFWAAFEAKSMLALIASMKIFAGLAIAYLGLKSAFSFLVDSIKINWRQWLTEKLISEYLDGENNYLELSRTSKELNNPSQRIQEDVDSFVKATISLSLNFIKSTLTQVTFISTLWVIGGPLAFTLFGANIIIPGYLVWVALALAISATGIKNYIGKRLESLNNTEANAEADFRSELEQIPQNAESIALERGETYFKNSLTHKFSVIFNNAYQKIIVRSSLAAFDGFYNQFSWIFPYLAAAPIYFGNAISLGQLMQIGFAFSEVNESFGWFMNSFEELSAYKTSIRRVVELREAIAKGNDDSSEKNIKIDCCSNQIIINNLQLNKPTGNNAISNPLNLTINENEKALIAGPSGLGKSTLLKAIAGTWKFGSGQITVPKENTMYVPQSPTIPRNSSLKAILAYPKPIETYKDEEYREVMTKADLTTHIDKLDENNDWGNVFSGGEKQRIAFARVFLANPEWVFLDESTSALDTSREEKLYKELPESYVSISHSQTVQKHHPIWINCQEENSLLSLAKVNAANDNHQPEAVLNCP